ncbi:MAG TPA: DNA-directed DNA polymerase II small subunit [Nitrososphaeraceae archaeon]|nr:DNA-directed DNA polymerase II small subunit [Nitrososphaeraceae archaeon]
MALQREISNAISYATSKGYQMHPDAFAMLKGLDNDVVKIVQDIIKMKIKQNENSLIKVDDIRNHINPEEDKVDIIDFEDSGKIDDTKINRLSTTTTAVIEYSSSFEQNSHKIILDPTPNINTGEGVEGYAALFRSRFEKSHRILALRPESKRIIQIASVKHNTNNAKAAKSYSSRTEGNFVRNPSSVVAGLLMSKRSKKNGIELVIDDYSGTLSALAVTEELKKLAMTLTLDQMVMLEIDNNNNNKSTQGFTIKNLASPDIPDHLPNRSKAEYYAVLISDLHVGSKYFMETEFMRFLTWLSSSEDELVRKIRFLCIGGDLIDGIGIFPNQDKELLELNTSKQMAHVIDLLAKIPKHIKVFIIPGNHDPGRRSLPQPSLPRKDADKLYSFENFTMLGNPAFLELNGVKVLMYHGQSLDDIIATTPGLSYSKPAEAMKVLLKARHLSPIYGQRTPIAPEQEDMMVISEVPDVFHSGHVHVIDVKNYRGTLIVNSGTWQAQTKFQQTMGIVPTPGFAILINLATLQPFQMDFNH